MKLRHINRKRLLRAIHAATVALIFLAVQPVARAQTATGDGQGDITITGSGSNTFSFSTSSAPPLAAGGTLTIANSANLTSNSNSASYGIQVGSPSTVLNQGTISTTNSSGAPGNALYFAPLASGGISLSNTGTLSGASSTAGYARGVLIYDVQTGTVTITNSGTISGYSEGALALGVVAHAGTGPLTLTNNAGGTISATSESSNYGDAVYLIADSGSLTIANAGTISGTGDVSPGFGIQAGSGGGNISITNSGLVEAALQTSSDTGSLLGIYANESSGSGTLSVVNTGTVTAVGTAGNATAISLNSSGSGPITLTSSGVITADGDETGYGINITNNGAGNITITNSGSVQASGGNSASAIQWEYTSSTNLGNALVTNSGALSVTSGSNVYGINDVLVSNPNSQVSDTVINSGAITLSSAGSGGGDQFAYGISAQQLGAQTVINSGAITITAPTGDVFAEGISASGGTVSVSNSGALNVTAAGGAAGVFVDGLSTTVTNSGPITVIGTGSSTAAAGIDFFAGNITVSNTGSITAIGTSQTSGLQVSCYAGDVRLSNSGNITASDSGSYSGSGIYVNNNGGNISVSNSGRLVAAASSPSYSASGIYTICGLGATAIVNNGSALGVNAGGGAGYGIEAEGSGPITITNNGSAEGSTAGIFANGAATVNNYGFAAGETYSIQVASGSTVNLLGTSSVQGLLKGGGDDRSTSLLNFQLLVTGSLNAAKTALDRAIAAYEALLAATPKEPNVDVTSTVVTINGVDYQWQDFAEVTDNLRSYALTPGYQGIGTAIDNFNPGSSQGGAILGALSTLSASQLPGALAQLSPQSLRVLRNIAFDGAGFTAANVNDHLANLRDGLTGFDASGFTVNAAGVNSLLASVRSHLLAWCAARGTPGVMSDSPAALFGGGDAKEMTPAVHTQPVDRWSTFISGSVILGSLDNTFSNLGDADFTTGSVMAGADYRLDDHFTVGAFFDYSHTGADLDGNSSRATVDSFMPGVYGSYVDGPWYANGMAAYGFNRDHESRNVDIPGIAGADNASADGGQVTANLTGGYEFRSGAFKFGPMATLQYVHLHVGTFNESGLTSLTIGNEDDDSLRTQLGFEARYSTLCATCYGPISFTPHLQASWQHEYLDNSDGITASFTGAGGGSFVTQGGAPERDSAFFDVGIDAGIASNLTFFLDYQAQAGQDHFFGQSAQGGLRISF